MFSFFKKKEHDSSNVSKQTDDFVVVESSDQQPESTSLYPPINPPMVPYPPNSPSMPNLSHQDSSPFLLIKDVPFSLSKSFESDNTYEIMLMEVKEILQRIEKQLEDDYCQYDFNTEKSVLNEFTE